VAALRDHLVRLAISLPFRCAVAVVLLAIHCWTLTKIGRDRFDYKFDADPAHAPMFYSPATDVKPDKWDRLVVSRWDSQHYEALALRGYASCKDKSQLGSGEYPDDDITCELNFYPTYAFAGGWLSRHLGQPVDYALFGLSLAGSFVFLLLWTGRSMVDGLGVGNTWLSLLLLNAFSTGYSLVTVQTEPCMLALMMGTFVCLRKRWFLAGAILAGAATSIRVTGVATGLAFSAALVFLTLREHPRPRWVWAWRAALAALSGWGVILLMAYYWYRFGDPLIYGHSHQRAFHHTASLSKLLFPDGRLLLQSIWAEPNDGLILAVSLFWFALGHRKGLIRFAAEAQVFWYALFIVIVGVSMYGTATCAFCGSSRYMFTIPPIFFAMAGVMRRRPVVLGLWLVMSTVHYYQANECFYVSQNYPTRLQRCAFPRNFRTDQLSAGEE
jgi:hypothetical protein